MNLFNTSVERLIPSNLAHIAVEASQIMSFIEAILFCYEGKINGTRICCMTVLVISIQCVYSACGLTNYVP